MTSELCRSHNTRYGKFGNTEVTQIVTRPHGRNQAGALNANWKGGRSRDAYRYAAKYRALYPDKDRARDAVYRAVRSGRLIRPDACQRCGAESRPQAHHADYSQPLAVTWLCRQCHTAEHPKRGSRVLFKQAELDAAISRAS